jgi:hypothetical protein
LFVAVTEPGSGVERSSVEELVMLAVFSLTAGALAFGWWVFSRNDADQAGDARSSVTAGTDGTMTVVVANPASEPVVVTACARPAGRLRLFGRAQIHRARTQQERRSSSRASRQLLGSVPPGGEATWTVVGDASTRPVCRVVLSLYQPNGRVRVHESVVRTEPGLVDVGEIGRRSFARPQHGTGR